MTYCLKLCSAKRDITAYGWITMALPGEYLLQLWRLAPLTSSLTQCPYLLHHHHLPAIQGTPSSVFEFTCQQRK